MFILFDIGGTKTRIAGSENLDIYTPPVKFDTPKTYREGIQKMIETIDGIRGTKPITGIAGGMRGVLNHERTRMVRDPGNMLSDWAGRPLIDDLRKGTGAPAYLENDTAIVGLGEAVFGAGKGYSIVAYHTVSTGVGGARFVDGKIDRSSVGFEPGHQELDIDRSILGPHTRHTLENLISGTALEKRSGKKPYDIAQSDPIWDELALYLAHGVKNTILYWSPDAVVLGGSMVIGDPRILLEDIKKHTQTLLGDLVPMPPILDATLKDVGGLYGAIALLRHHHA